MNKHIGLTVDAVILRGRDEILLVRRSNEPFKGYWALPGGFVEYGERVEDAVAREVREETGLDTRINRLVGVYSDSKRDPRGHTVSIVFECAAIGGKAVGGDDADEARWFDIKTLGEVKLAFDHRKIIEDAIDS